MLGIGTYEILIVLFIICIVGRPEEIPSYLQYVKKSYNYLVRLKSEIYDAIGHDHYVKGDDGVMYKSYKNDRDKEIK